MEVYICEVRHLHSDVGDNRKRGNRGVIMLQYQLKVRVNAAPYRDINHAKMDLQSREAIRRVGVHAKRGEGIICIPSVGVLSSAAASGASCLIGDSVR